MFASIYPATGELIGTYAEHDAAEIDRRLTAAWTGWQAWRQTGMTERTSFLNNLATLLERRADQYAAMIVKEMGKPIREAIAEVRKCASTARHFAAAGPGYLEPRPIATEAQLCQVQYEPLGPVLAIMPWNFPFWQVFRFFIPSVLAGNTAVLKHAENVQGCARAIEELVQEAGHGHTLLVNLLVDRGEVATLIGDQRIRAVTLTGSVRAGRSVASAAGQINKKVVLELGGSDPFIVMSDADLDRVVPMAVTGRFGNGGQTCISAKRFIVAGSIADRFTEAFAAGVAALKVGDPLDQATTMGPLAREDLRDGVAGQVRQSVEAGARVVIGGRVPERPGFFYEPTILTNINPSSPAAVEEIFGPAAAVIPFETVEEAVEIANSTPYGLGASIWSEDLERASALADQIESGCVFINSIVKSDARLPFGGVKASGYGRELGELGARELTNAKLKWIT